MDYCCWQGYGVLPGKAGEFVSAFKGIANALNKAEEHEQSRLYQDCDARGRYLILSRWSDEAAFQRFIASEAFRNVTNWGKKYPVRQA
jgi:heme-degrading monooxygenase HmoA